MGEDCLFPRHCIILIMNCESNNNSQVSNRDCSVRDTTEVNRRFCIDCDYKNDKYVFSIKYYDGDSFSQQVQIANGDIDGYRCYYQDGNKTTIESYEQGKLIKKYTRKGDYWEWDDNKWFNSQQILCTFNQDLQLHGKVYTFYRKRIQKIERYVNGKMIQLLKEFKGKKMIEYDATGKIIYGGGYSDDFEQDYPRSGYGTGFYDNGYLYEGKWKDGFPYGKGRLSMDNIKYKGVWKKGILYRHTSMTYPWIKEYLARIGPNIVIDQLPERLNERKREREEENICIIDSLDCFNTGNNKHYVVKGCHKKTKLLNIECNMIFLQIMNNSLNGIESLHIQNCNELECIEINTQAYQGGIMFNRSQIGSCNNVKELKIAGEQQCFLFIRSSQITGHLHR